MLHIEDNIHLFTLVKFVMYTVGMVVGAAILIREVATGQMTRKMGVSCILSKKLFLSALWVLQQHFSRQAS